MKNILVINLLDYHDAPNGRIHHLITYIRKEFKEAVSLYGSTRTPKGAFEFIKNFFLFTINVRQEGNLKEVQVNPFLNYTDGLAKRITGYPGISKQKKGFNVRLWLERIISPLGIVKEACIVLCYLFSYFLKIRKKFDVCLVQCPLTGLVGYILKKLGRVRLMVYDDIDYAPGWMQHTLRQKWTAFLERYCMKRADLVVSCSRLLGELRQKELKREVFVVNNGINYGMFAQTKSRSLSEPALVYCGRIVEWAGLENTLSALQQLKHKIPGIKFHIIGSGEPAYENRIKRLISHLGLTDSVIFKGEIRYEQLPQYLSECHIGIACFRPQALKRFAFSLKVIEYMASGLPVICTEDTEAAEVVSKYDCGRAVEFDPSQIGDAIYALLNEPRLYLRYSLNGKKSSAEFDWDNLMGKLVSYIREPRPSGRGGSTDDVQPKEDIKNKDIFSEAMEFILRLFISVLWLLLRLASFGREKKIPGAFTTAPKILIIQRDYIGDVLFTTPSLRLLRKLFPDSHITVVTRGFGKELLSGIPYIDALIASDGLLDRNNSLKDLCEFFKLALTLRKNRYDIVINFTKAKALVHAVLTYLTFAAYRIAPLTEERVGFFGSRGFRPLHNIEVELNEEGHVIDYFLKTIRLLGNRFDSAMDRNMEFFIPDEDKRSVDAYLKERSLEENNILVGIHTGAGRKDKCLSQDILIQLSKKLINDYPAKLVFTGVDSEFERIRSIMGAIGHDRVFCAVDLSLKQLAALLGRCNLFISADTGPLHIAEILGIPTISFFGADSPIHTGPLGEKHIILRPPVSCSPCSSFLRHWPRPFERCRVKCMDLITWEDISKAIVKQMDKIAYEKSRICKANA